MRFFKTKHCKTFAHCHACRDKEGGRTFRAQLAAKYEDILTVDFVCPIGLQWGSPPQTIMQAVQGDALGFTIKSRLDTLPSTLQGDWARIMVKQCLYMLEHPPKFIRCNTQKAFAKRFKEKIEYYLTLYDPDIVVVIE